MPNKKISELDSFDQLIGNEKFPIVQSGANKTSDVSILGTKLNSDVGSAITPYATRVSSNLASAKTSNLTSDLTTIQDLTGIKSNLHVSPNAVTAMFVYDTSKDSDGGAWTEKCQHTSWYNEPLSGKWLGAHKSEFQARNKGATVSATELLPNGDFSNGTTGWNVSAGTSAVNGQISVNSGQYSKAWRQLTVEIGKTYRFTGSIFGKTANFKLANTGPDDVNYSSDFGNAFGNDSSWTNYEIYFQATSTVLYVTVQTDVAGVAALADNLSIREVIAQTTQSNDYFQLTTDGKFYRLWRNLIQSSEVASTFSAYINGGSISETSAVSPPTGLSKVFAFTESKGASSTHYSCIIIPQTGTLNSVGSVYVKAGSRSVISFGVGGGLGVTAKFDFTSGLFISNTASVVATSVGNGWWRFSQANSSGTVISINIRANDVNNSETYVGDGSVAYYVTGAQSEESFSKTVSAYEQKINAGTTTEVFRGNKREFPKLSAIVAESSNVTIYDLTEPGRPMWMRFSLGDPYVTSTFLGVTSNNTVPAGAVLSIRFSALNGNLCFGVSVSSGNGNAAGLRFVSFIYDSLGNYVTNNFGFIYGWNIANRQADFRNKGVKLLPGIASQAVNAVAMTVLPDAPIDPVTGLQVPTIAVATASGLSVIKQNGSVVNSAETVNFGQVTLTPQILSYGGGSAGRTWRYILNPGALTSGFAATGWVIQGDPSEWQRGGSVPVLKSSTRSQLARTSGTDAMVIFRKNNETAISKAVHTTITNTYNTGHQVGDIRRTYISDVISENISGTELVANGKFDTDLSGWDNSPGVWSWNAGKATSITNGAAGDLVIIGGVVGKTYEATFTITDAVGSGIYISLAGNDIGYYGNGTFRIVSTCTSTTKFFRIRKFTADGGSIDNISIKEVVADRSYKSAGASLYGALAKSPVANNAQLVGYSGFSNSNYLREPASTDLDFGTGEWSSSCWINIPTTITASTIFHRGYSSGALFELKVDATGKIITTITDSAATPVTRTITSTNTYNTGTWNKVDVTYATNGTLSLYVNGQQAATPVTGSALASINNTNAVLTIGNNYSLNAPFPGSLSLLKLSATVPTIEQLQWMYEQEKMMFQPGAQVCLPSSGAVNDLSYDSKTDTWYVAQSSHLSEFKGLVRTAYRKPATSTYSKIASDSGVKLIARASGTVELEIAPIQIKKEFSSSVIDSTINNQNISIFEFDSIASQTDFVLPVGYTAQAVYLAGTLQIEGASKNYTRLFDGFRETIRFGTAPATNSWVKIKAVRS